MKYGLMLALLFVSQLSMAQTLKAKKVKAEMLERVDTLTTTIEEAREALANEEVKIACEKINDLFKLYPDHLVAIGTRMNIFDGKVIKMEQETKMHLIYMHQQSNVCARGETGDYLDVGDVNRKLNAMRKSLIKQQKRIKKMDTDYNNTYNYYYEFH